MDKEYIAFRLKWLTAIRKKEKFKYYPINRINKFIRRKWIKDKANLEYDKYIIEEHKETKVSFSEQNEIKEFDKELPANQ